MVESRFDEFACLVDYMVRQSSERARILLQHFDTRYDVQAQRDQPIALADAMGLRDALWWSDHLLIKLRLGGVKEKSAELQQAYDACDLILSCAVQHTEDYDSSPSAPQRHVGAVCDLANRIKLIDEAISLDVPHLDQVVSHIYCEEDAPQTRSRGQLIAHLERLPCFHKLDEPSRCKLLDALGVPRVDAPSTEVQWSTAEASDLCAEVWRTLCEAQLKLDLRLWFSAREQTVWRTLSGLMKGSAALEMMQRIGASKQLQAAEEAKLSDVRDMTPSAKSTRWRGALAGSVYTVTAALQIYSQWKANLAKCIEEAKKKRAAWSENPTGIKGEEDLHNALFGADKLAFLLDQCLSVAYLHRQYSAVQIASIKSGWEHHSVLSSGHKVDVTGNLPTLEEDCSWIADPLGGIVKQRTLRKVKLQGNPITDGLAEGKPVNQSNALLHCTTEVC